MDLCVCEIYANKKVGNINKSVVSHTCTGYRRMYYAIVGRRYEQYTSSKNIYNKEYRTNWKCSYHSTNETIFKNVYVTDCDHSLKS